MRRRITSGSRFEAEIGYSRAVVVADCIHVSGTTGVDYATGALPAGAVAQARQAVRNIEAALAEAGATLADVVRVRYILPDRADFAACVPVLRDAFGEAAPAATMIVAGLIDPAMKIEIEVDARLTPPAPGVGQALPPGSG